MGYYLLLAVKIVGTILALHTVTVVIVFLLARIKKDAEGNYILDPNSWHFRLAYPFKRKEYLKNRSYDKNYYEDERIGICRYFAKLSWMLYVGWPILLFVEFIRTILLFPFFFLGGRVIVPSVESLHSAAKRDNVFEFVDTKDATFKLGKVTVLPLYWLVPSVYALLFWQYRAGTVHYTFWTLGIILAAVVIVAIIAGISAFIGWFLESNGESVSLMREWTGAKIRGVCPLAKIVAPKS